MCTRRDIAVGVAATSLAVTATLGAFAPFAIGPGRQGADHVSR
jgi:hypothetical protein